MFAPTDVPRPSQTFWVGGEGWVKVVQPEPRREVFLAGPAAALWERIDAQESTVAELMAGLEQGGVCPEQTLAMLERLRAMHLITAERYLWQEGSS